MKKMNLSSRSFFVTCFMLLSSFCLAQLPISEVIDNVATSSVPFNATKRLKLPLGSLTYSITNQDKTIPDKLYHNIQLTEYEHASIAPELGAVFTRKFAIPNSNRFLIVVTFGHGYGDNDVHVLCVANPDGTIVSTLIGTVMGRASYVKQFRINEYNEIIVTSIVPTSTVSIPFETFTSFEGTRHDITYSIDASGQFVEESKGRIYGSRVYTRSYLEDESVNLWEGGETFKKPMNPPRRPRE
jgi:hypothetical protein